MNKPTDDEISHFTLAYCHCLVRALHFKTGWKIKATFAFYPESIRHRNEMSHLVHAFVVNPEGKAVDIRGVHKGGMATVVTSPRERHYACGKDFIFRTLVFSTWKAFSEFYPSAFDNEVKKADKIIQRCPKHFGLSRRNPISRAGKSPL